METSSVFGHGLQGNSIRVRLSFNKKPTIYTVQCLSHLTDPGDEGSHAGKHCGLLRSIASLSTDKTSHSLDIPFTVSALTVQGATRITLGNDGTWLSIGERCNDCLTEKIKLCCCICCSLRGMLTCSLLLHRPLLSWLRCPTSHFYCRYCDPPQEAEPAAG